MNVPDLSQMLISLTQVFPLVTQLMFLLMAVMGLWVGFKGLQGLYALSTGETKFSNRSPSYDSAFGQLVLAGALVVAPVVFWRFANTFVLGGQQTYDMFIIGSASKDASYCKQIHGAISWFFMALGAIAWVFASLQLYDATRGERLRSGSATVYLVGGILCFFINDVSTLISATVGMEVTFENVCTIMGDEN